MKQIVKAFIILLGFTGLPACNDLELPPLNVITDADVFKNEAGINGYMARLYGELPIEDHNFSINGFGGGFNALLGNWSGEVLQNVGGYHQSPSGDKVQWWKYGSVRNVNYFLELLPQYKDNFFPEQVDSYLGEAYFIRAYYYFSMVKRYGGVPVIDKLQNYPQQDVDELKVERDKEVDVYDFICNDLDEAIRLLPEKELQKGRANKGVAYALKSRAMLYAASIAQYGTVQLSGILGIPQSESQRFYQLSYDASVEVSKRYSLYRKYSDKFENYWNLFLDEDSPESIFVKDYFYPNLTHSFDCYNVPFQMRGASGYGSKTNPTLEIVELFEDIEGHSGTLEVEENGQSVRYDNMMDLFEKVEPRLRASVILPGDLYKGEIIDVQKGLYTSYPNGELKTSTNWNDVYSGDKGSRHITGKSGIGNSESTTTGFHIRKYQNPNMDQSVLLISRSEQSYIDIRYAEIVLNRAEAAFALGKKEAALVAVNEIRERAGSKLCNIENLTEKLIRKERRRELVFENQSYWDLRRWRIATEEINNKIYTALCPYYVYDEGKYIFKKEPVGTAYTFDSKEYYQMIPTEEINKNDLLEQNPGY